MMDRQHEGRTRALKPRWTAPGAYRALAHAEVVKEVVAKGPLTGQQREDLVVFGLVRLLQAEAQRRGYGRVELCARGGERTSWGRWVLVGERWLHAGSLQRVEEAGLRACATVWRILTAKRSVLRRVRGEKLDVWAVAVVFDGEEGEVEQVAVNEDAVEYVERERAVVAVLLPEGEIAYGATGAESWLVEAARREFVSAAVEAVHEQALGNVSAPGGHGVRASQRHNVEAVAFPGDVVLETAEELARAGGLDTSAFLLLCELAWEELRPYESRWGPGRASPLSLPAFFPAPTSILPVIPTMRPARPVSHEVRLDLSHAEPRRLSRWEFANQVVVCVRIEEGEEAAGIAKAHEAMLRMLDPLALKVLYGCLLLCSQRGAPEFYYRPERMLDLLGYRRDERGSHYSRNRRRIDERLLGLSQLIFEFRFRREPYTVRVREPLVAVDLDATVEVEVDGRTLARGTRVRVSRILWQDVSEGRFFTWLDPRFLRIDPRSHADALLLYPYYATSWRIDWRRSGGQLRRRLRSILAACGVDAESLRARRKLGQRIARIEEEHDFLEEWGLIGGWDILEFSPADRLDELWQVLPPPAWYEKVEGIRRVAGDGQSRGVNGREDAQT